jgi:xylulose-5-phosphate/fructose-6-phosphate phosphoketolase
MVVLNETSRFHLAIDAIRRSRRALPNAQVLIDACLEMLARHATHLAEHLEDLPEIRNWTWTDG